MARYGEVAAGSFGHTVRISLDVDLTINTPTLRIEFKPPGGGAVVTRIAQIDTADPSNKTMKYLTVSGDFGSAVDTTTYGVWKIVALLDYGANGIHRGRPPLRVTAADPYS